MSDVDVVLMVVNEQRLVVDNTEAAFQQQIA